MQKYDIEYSTYSFERLTIVINNLLKDGYVCRIGTEGDLYVLDAIGTYNCNYRENGVTCYDADRNETIFMNKDIFEENYTELNKEEKENVYCQ